MINCSYYSLVDITTHWFIDYRAWVAAARTPAESPGASEGVKGVKGVKQPVEKNRKDTKCFEAFAIICGYNYRVTIGVKKNTITVRRTDVGTFPSFTKLLIMGTRLPVSRASTLAPTLDKNKKK